MSAKNGVGMEGAVGADRLGVIPLIAITTAHCCNMLFRL
jgi:hypothetical protein